MVNKAKTMLTLFGGQEDKSILAERVGIKWCTKCTLLGIDFDRYLEEMDLNFEKAVKKMKKWGKN